jgi:hypothetical protein
MFGSESPGRRFLRRMILLDPKALAGVVVAWAVPAWAKRLTVMYAGLSSNGTSGILVRIGANGALEATGYVTASTGLGAGAVSTAYTTGFGIRQVAAADLGSGEYCLTLLNPQTNLWTGRHSQGYTTAATVVGGGHKQLPGAISVIALATFNGTDIFDGGSANVLVEG